MEPKDFIEMLEMATEEEMAQIKTKLGVGAKGSSVGVRVSGKLQRTEKVLEAKVARQMQILIDTLPADRAIDVAEWTKLALEAGMQTQQAPERITMYYKKQIVDGGYAVNA